MSDQKVRATGVYIAGSFYALAFFAILDSALYSRRTNNEPGDGEGSLPGLSVHVTFTDWIPFLVSSLGMLIINTVDKLRLSSESFSFGAGSGTGESDADWQAKVVLFLGFAFLAGGVAGSIVILVLKYIVPDIPMPTLGMGILNVISNGSVMISCIILWLAQSLEDDYSYSLQL